MSWKNRVLWTEGLFLQPHHFQQQDRYLEFLVEAKSRQLAPYPWGFHDLQIDPVQLEKGFLAIVKARGILPDGTPFSVPDHDPAPPPLGIDESVKNQTAYLSIPLQRPGYPEVRTGDKGDAATRYVAGTVDIRDDTGESQAPATIGIGKLSLSFLLERDVREGFAGMGVARIVECRADRATLLDETYIAPCLDYQASRTLNGYVEQLRTVARSRIGYLKDIVGDTAGVGVSNVEPMLQLQLVNRIKPLMAHLTKTKGLHPETLFRHFISLAGEMASFSPDKCPPDFPDYNHDDLKGTFEPVFKTLNADLTRIIAQPAKRIPIEDRQLGYRVAFVENKDWLDMARFVLAVNAKMDRDEMRNLVPKLIRIASSQDIERLVHKALEGIRIVPLDGPAPEIPPHAGFTYFALDRNSEFWERLKDSGTFVMNVGARFPDIQLELWAILRE